MGQQYDDREWRRHQQERDGSWFVPGPYAGVGPRDYRRTDEQIYEEVCERLAQHGRINASDIEVKVQDGEVTLEGGIPDRRQKRLAEDVIDSIWGVNDIHNHLRIREGQGSLTRGGDQEREWKQDHPQESTTVTVSPTDLGASTITTPSGDLGPGGSIMGMPDTGVAAQAAALNLGLTEMDTDETDLREDNQDLHEIDLKNVEPGMGMHEGMESHAGMLGGLRDQVHEGMDVMAADGEMVGKVKEIRESDFLLDRPMARDVYVPYDSAEISDERVRLTIPSDQISRMDWPSPDVFGS